MYGGFYPLGWTPYKVRGPTGARAYEYRANQSCQMIGVVTMSEESILGEDVPNLGNMERGGGGSDTGLADRYGNPASEELHRKSNKEGQEWHTYEKDGETFVYPKKGKADECKRRAEQRKNSDAGVSKVDGEGEDENEDQEQVVDLRERAVDSVENITGNLQLILGPSWKPDDQEKQQLVQAQVELLQRYPEARGLPIPWYAKVGYAWGMYAKKRILGGPGGIYGLVDVYSRLMAYLGSEDEDDQDDDETPPDDPDGIDKYPGLGDAE